MTKLEIHKYKIEGDERHHNVPKHSTPDFEEAVSSLDRKWEHLDKMTYHPTEGDYRTRSEDKEYINRTGDKENFYHPLEGLDYQEIEAVLETVKIKKYRVSYQNQYSWIVYCPHDGYQSFEKFCADYQHEFELLDEDSISIKQYQDFCNNHLPYETPIPIGQYDDLAYLFNQEVNNRNINKEDLTMTPATETKPSQDTQDTQAIQFDGANLSLYLKKCSREFLDELILTFGDEGVKALDFAHTTKAKRASAYDLMIVEENEEKFLIVKEFYELVVGNASQMKEALADFQKAKEEYQEVKDSYQSKLDARVKKLGNQFKIKKEHRKQHNEILGKLQRAKQIKKGLKGYGTAVALAHIDDIQDQVIASASYIASKTSELAKKEKLDDKTFEGTERLVDKLSGKIDNLVANVQTEDGQPNALANRLVVETKTQMDNLNAKVKEAEKEVKQPA